MYEERLSRVCAVFAGALILLGSRAFWLQCVARERILEAQDARIHGRFIVSARRGDVTWADGTAAATDEPAFSVLIDPAAFEATRYRCGVCGAVTRPRSIPTKCAECGSGAAPDAMSPPDVGDLARTLRMSLADLGGALDRVIDEQASASWLGVYVLCPRVEREAAIAVAAAASRFPGVSVRPTRDRVVDPAARRIVGATRQAWKQELEELTDKMRPDRGERLYSEAEVYAMRFGVGGLEAAFDGRLRGSSGEAFRPRPKNGLVAAPVVRVPVVDGEPVHTTLRRNVQTAACEVVRRAPGDAAAVVLDVSDGAVVAIASNSTGNLNRAVCGLLPGSVYKLVTALAALDAGVSPDEQVVCACRGLLPSGRRYKCDETHGAVDLRGAFAESCNAYFETMAERVGPDAMIRAARALGLDASPRLHLPGSRAGLSVTLPRSGVFWPGEMRYLGKGMGRASASPLQIAIAYARVAAGGRRLTPFLVAEEAPGAPDVDPTIARFAPILCEGARRCVTSGTAASVPALAAIDAAGKSGTADTAVGMKQNNAWFVAFAPYSKPRYVAVVVFEKVEGKGAGTVGPIVARLLEEALR